MTFEPNQIRLKKVKMTFSHTRRQEDTQKTKIREQTGRGYWLGESHTAMRLLLGLFYSLTGVPINTYANQCVGPPEEQ